MTSILALLVPTAAAADWTVGPEGDFTNLQDAVDAAADGDRIRVDEVYADVVVIDGRTLAIEGLAPEAAVRELHLVDSDVDLIGLTIQDAFTVEGGSVVSEGMRFDGAGDMRSSAITILSGEVALSGARIGAWDTPESPVTIYDGTVSIAGFAFEDTSGDDGGAIRIEGGSVTIESTDFDGVRAQAEGGAIAIRGGVVDIDACSFADGSATSGGFIASDGGIVRVVDSSFEGGRAERSGGSIYATASAFHGRDIVFEDSQSLGEGGAIAVMGGAFAAVDVGSRDAQAGDGGHIWASGGATLDLVRSALEGGQAVRGGAVYNEHSTVRASNALWTGIEYAEAGGGYYQDSGSLELSYAVLADNGAEIGAGFAVEDGDATMDAVLVYGNHGEAGVNVGPGSVEMTYSLVYGNSSDQPMGVTLGEGAGWADPRFESASGGDWAIGSFSPALDVGSELDRDGTWADMGVFGGPDAWELPDADGDGWVYGRDCDDSDPLVNEFQTDKWYDGIDSDCAGDDDFDQDGDGDRAAQYGGGDCDDTDPARSSLAEEITRDEIDSDCDGLLDRDGDGDGWSEAVDCDDTDPTIHPGAEDAPYDGIDSDCRNDPDNDADHDGWPRGEDCDDDDPRVSPSAPEIADDGIDQDCDGSDLTMDLGDEDVSEPVEPDLGPAWAPTAPAESTAITTGCSSAPHPSNFAAALMVLAGLLLHRRRR